MTRDGRASLAEQAAWYLDARRPYPMRNRRFSRPNEPLQRLDAHRQNGLQGPSVGDYVVTQMLLQQ